MDESILRLLNGHGVLLAQAFSSKWMLVAVGVPLLGYLGKKRNWRAILSIVFAIGLSDLVVVRVLKPTVGRERPCRALTEIEAPNGCGPGKSFPSAHASNAFAICVSAAAYVPHGKLILLPIAALVAWSRVALGVHYPSDILFGAVFGTLFALLCNFLATRISKPSPSSSTS